MKYLNKFLIPVLYLFCLLISKNAFAQYQYENKSAVQTTLQTKIDMHERMGEIHRKTAACLQSGKAEDECHKDMMTQCAEAKKGMIGNMDCKMMGKMHSKMQGTTKK